MREWQAVNSKSSRPHDLPDVSIFPIDDYQFVAIIPDAFQYPLNGYKFWLYGMTTTAERVPIVAANDEAVIVATIQKLAPSLKRREVCSN